VEAVFVPVATAKSSLVGSLVTIGPSKIIGDLDALSKRLGLPMQAGQELLSSLGSLGLVGDAASFRALWDHLDATAPVAIAWVLPAQAAAKGYCAALTFQDAALARRGLDGLGKPGAARDGVVERKVPDGSSIWAATKGRTLFVSNSADALLLAGGLAEAAQVGPHPNLNDGQVLVSVLPQALAKASGQSNQQIVAHLTAALGTATQAAGSKTSPGAQRMMVGLAESLAQMALQIADLRLVFDVGPRQGILVRAEIEPLPGSDLATRIARRAPYAFDERLPIRSDGTVVLALGDLSPWFLPFAQAFEASGPAGQAMRKDMTHWFGIVGDVACVVEPVAVGFTSLCSSSLKPGADPKLAVDTAVALLTSQNAWEAELEGRKASPLKIKRKKDSVEVDKKIQNTDATARAMAKAMAGGDSVKTVVAVKSGRLVQGTGQRAAEFVSSYGPVAGVKNAPLVAATLAATKGMEGVASVDVVAILLRLFGKAKDLPGAQLATVATALPGVTEMKAPLVLELLTGRTLTVDFRIPLGSLDNIGKVVQGVLGAGPGPAR
jgi:hypothetical protein